jgi:hypothetical protein
MSVKSVPGCLVLMAPSTIGVPDAATPGLGPHDDVSEVPPEPLAVEVADAAVLPVAAAPGAAAVVLLLLPAGHRDDPGDHR